MMLIDCYTTPGAERETCMEAHELLRQMDRASVDCAVIAPEDREIAVDNVLGNRRIFQMASESKGRFIPACTVNPWFGDKGIAEMKRAAIAGARLLVLAPALQGFVLTDEICDGLFPEAAQMNLPVYVHSGPHSSSCPTQLALVAERFQQCRFILGHCGSTDYSYDMPPVFGMKLPNLWFELSFVRPWLITAYVQQAGESRIIFGSSCPRNDLAFELEQSNSHWPIKDHPETYGGNLLRLIKEVQA